ncbi:MAG: O-sialoglycoprotein endopeptidase [Christensenellaceae bacterium]|nr:O-sialoglycoprotein endopeptidase [Christensenellaceae bacterium]
MRYFLGIDTSCYTTSCAVVNEQGEIICDNRILLTVPEGGRGLRQSDMLFEHTKNLPSVFPVGFSGFTAVAVSTRPRPKEGSYMPVFRAAEAFGTAAAGSSGAPLYKLSHQHGHIGAALIGNDLEGEFLVLHVSGGTTDVLKASAQNRIIREIEGLGETSDLSAGQLIDRTGVKLGLAFPAGPHLEKLAEKSTDPVMLKSVVKGLLPSFSGAEAAVCRMIENGVPAEDIAAGVERCVANTLEKMIRAAREQTDIFPVLLVGGVMQNQHIRARLNHRLHGLHFAKDRLSADNACGLAMQARNIYFESEDI